MTRAGFDARFMKNGKIDWEKVERQVSQVVNTAVETVAGAVKQRYVNDDGSSASPWRR